MTRRLIIMAIINAGENMKMTTLLISVAIASLPAVGLAAKCPRSDLAGTWRVYTVFQSVIRCTLVMSSSGVIGGRSSCYAPDIFDSVPATGKLVLTADCHVTGSINANAQQRYVDGWVSKGKDSISGIGWKPGNVFAGNVFSGVKQ